MRASYRLLEDKEQHVARDLHAEVCVTSPASLLGLPWLVCECLVPSALNALWASPHLSL